MEQLQELLGMEIDPEDELAWTDGKTINETLFAEQFLKKYQLIYSERAFFSPDGRVSDPDLLRSLIFAEISPYIVTNISRKVTNIVDVLKMSVFKESLPLETDRIHLANGTLFLNGDFHEGKNVIVRSRLPVIFNANAPKPERWLSFLQELFYEEDIPTVQEIPGILSPASHKGSENADHQRKRRRRKDPVRHRCQSDVRMQREGRQHREALGKPFCTCGSGAHPPDGR